MLHGNLPARKSCYEVRGLLVHPENANHFLIATGSMGDKPEGILRSLDGGTTWERVLQTRFYGNGPLRGTGFVLARHPTQPDTVAAASAGDGVWISQDGGTTWECSGPKDLYATDIRFDLANPNRLWLCAQQVKSWAFDLKSGFFRSEDGGRSWNEISGTAPSEILQDPVAPDRLFGIFDHAEIRVSVDTGDSWSRFHERLPFDPVKAKTAHDGHRFGVLSAGPDFVLTGTGDGTCYRLNAGETAWKQVQRVSIRDEGWWASASKGGDWLHFGKALSHITIDPRNPEHWLMTDWYALHQTYDAGANWELTIDGIETTVIHALAQDPNDPGIVHLGMADNGYLLSVDGGASFRHVPIPDGGNNIKSMTLSPRLSTRLYVTGPAKYEWRANQVFVSVDRGSSWTRSPMTGLPEMAGHNCNSIAVDPANPFTVFLAVSGEVAPGKGGPYRSIDGGESWTWIGQGLPLNEKFYTDSIWDSGKELAVSADGRSVVTTSRDASSVYRLDAETGYWTPCDSMARGMRFSVVADPLTPGTFYLANRWDGLYRSRDAGNSWKRILDGDVSHVALDQAGNGRIATGSPNGIFYSEDAGVTWKTLAERMPYRVHNTLAFAGDRLIAGSTGNGAFWMPLTDEALRPLHAGALDALEYSQEQTELTIQMVEPTTTEKGQNMRLRTGAAVAVVTALAVTNGLAEASDAVLPVIENGNGEAVSAGVPESWKISWKSEGSNPQLVSDSKVVKEGKASVRLNLGGAEQACVVANTFEVWRYKDAGKTRFKVTGAVKCEGENIAKCEVAVQLFDKQWKQCGWQSLIEAKSESEWKTFWGDVEIPAKAVNANLVLTFKGKGSAWLDGVAVMK